MKTLHLSLALTLLPCAASAQSMNIDLGDAQSAAGGVASTHGAATGQSGFWNLKGEVSNHSGNLRDLQDQPTTAYCWVTDGAPGDFYSNNSNTGSASALLNDCMSYSVPLTWGINGLENGTYEVTIYAFAPDDPVTYVSLVGAIPAPDYNSVSVGGTQFGTNYQEGVTHTTQVVHVQTGYIGISLGITNGFGSFSGLQITKVSDLHSHFCFGDGEVIPGCIPCPCGNDAPSGTVGGCLNSEGKSGKLRAWDIPSVSENRLRFSGIGMSSNSFAILISGSALAPVGPQHFCYGFSDGITSSVFDGLRCAALNVQRHGVRATDFNGQVFPGWGGAFAGPPAGIAAMGNFGVGETRYFQIIYRDQPQAGCGSGQNTTEAVKIDFVP